METLGDVLKAKRGELRLTLREVEEKTGLSNAYLSQLENGKIVRPSPTVLSRLAELYQTSFSHLMELAGHPTTSSEGKKTIVFRRLGRVEDISEEEERELAQYLRFLRTRRSEK